MSLIRKHGAVLQAWACLDLVSVVVSLCARSNWQVFCQFSSANQLLYRIVTVDAAAAKRCSGGCLCSLSTVVKLRSVVG